MDIQKRKGWIIAFGVLLASFVFLLVFLFSDTHKKDKSLEEPQYEYQESVYPTEVLKIPVYTDLLEIDDRKRMGEKRIIQYIVIHETANFSKGADAKNHASYLKQKNDSYTSWHYTVDDSSIYHHIPDDEIAHHAGDDEGNLHGIGIELCVNQDGDFDKTFTNGAKLAAYLLNAYHLKIDALKTHFDFSSKDCPHTILQEGRLEEFQKLVQYYQILLKYM